MKKLSFLFAALVAGVSFADGGWIFDSTAKTLTCGDNVIKNVTVKDKTKKTLTIGDNKSNANIVQLDLTLPIADGDGVAYTINPEQGSIGTWQGNKTLQMLVLPQPGCKQIQWDMFKNCTALTSVEIVEGTTTIGANSFNGCTSLASLTIPSTITSISSAAFQSTAIKSFVVPAGMETVSAGFVGSCSKLESFIVSEGVKSFGAGNFFSKTTSLKYVEFPSTLEQVTGTDWFDYAYNPCDVIWPVFPKKGFAAKNCPYGGHDNNNTKTNYIHWASRQEWIDYSATNAYGIVFNMPTTYDGLGSWVGNHTHVIKYYVPDGGVVPWEVSLVKEQSGDYTVGVTVANTAGKVYAKAVCDGEQEVIVQIGDNVGVGETATATLLASALTQGKSYAVTVYGESTDGEVVLGNFAGYAFSSPSTDKNYWLNTTGDGLASTSANWSRGTPVVGDDIVVEQKWCSGADLTWDIPSVASVASWTQDADYTGTVTMPTEFPNKGSFPLFTVTGALIVNGGKWTHPISFDKNGIAVVYTPDDIRAGAVYRLNVKAGSLTIGANGMIDAAGKGHSQVVKGAINKDTAHGGQIGSAKAYGNVKYPVDIGYAASSGTDNINRCAAGGGAVKLEVEGACVIDGEISVDGVKASGASCAGSAGSILIEATSVSGAGLIHAEGVWCGNNSYRNGAGGRIALLTTDPVDVSKLTVSAGHWVSGTSGASGTVYLKDSTMTDGVLYQVNRLSSSDHSRPTLFTPVTTEGDWTFDKIIFGGNTQLAITEGATLKVNGGLANIDASRNTTVVSGIHYLGGTFDFGGGDMVVAGKWYFCPIADFVFNGDVIVRDGAHIGFPLGYQQPAIAKGKDTSELESINLTVKGDMTVESTGQVTTYMAGGLQESSQVDNTKLPISVHGGRRAADQVTIDSVFDPKYAGIGQNNSYSGFRPGGVAFISVSGTLTVAGKMVSDGIDSQSGGNQNCAGGTFNLQVGKLAGTGIISASSAKNRSQSGGRIAIRLTDEESSFDDFEGTIYANGWTASSAGSIYLQTASQAEKAGLIIIDNKDNVSAITTPICATGFGGDAVEDFKNASLLVRGKAIAEVSVAGLKLKSLEVAANSKLDLFGKTLTVNAAKLGDTKLKPGTYAAGDCPDYLIDSVGGGSLVVKGTGLMLLVR